MFIFAVNSIVASIYLCSWQMVSGGLDFVHVGTLLIFALQSAILSVILEWKHPIRGWKTESDLWHHPRKYLVPLIMLLVAAFVGTWTLALLDMCCCFADGVLCFAFCYEERVTMKIQDAARSAIREYRACAG